MISKFENLLKSLNRRKWLKENVPEGVKFIKFHGRDAIRTESMTEREIFFMNYGQEMMRTTIQKEFKKLKKQIKKQLFFDNIGKNVEYIVTPFGKFKKIG